jgi:hypothetical protein
MVLFLPLLLLALTIFTSENVSAANVYADMRVNFDAGDSTNEMGSALGNPKTNGNSVSLGHRDPADDDGILILEFTNNAIFNRDGIDFEVNDVGPKSEGYEVFADSGGTWESLGTGTGDDSFDLSNGGFDTLAKVTKIKIQDDGTVSPESGDDDEDGGIDVNSVKVVEKHAWDLVLNKVSSTYVPEATNKVTLSAQIDPLVDGKIKWKLEESSDEPGIAMNADTDAFLDDSSERDFVFETQTGWTLINSTKIEENSLSTNHEGDLTSRDFGSFGKVSAKIFEIDGSGEISPQIPGRQVPGDTPTINVPRDSNGNHIADSLTTWDDGNDTDDDDPTPEPDVSEYRIKGDSLTRYQEYRGFMTLSGHVRTDPTEKDFFTWNSDQIDSNVLTEANLGVPIHYVNSDKIGAKGRNTQKYREINFKKETADRGRQTASRVEASEDTETANDLGLWGFALPDSDAVDGEKTGGFVPNDLDTRPNDADIQNINLTEQQQKNLPAAVVFTEYHRTLTGAELTENISSSDTVIPVNSVSNYRGAFSEEINDAIDGGKIKIGDEIIRYDTAVNDVSNNVFEFRGITRGIESTSATAHSLGEEVFWFALPEEAISHTYAHENGHTMNLFHPETLEFLGLISNPGKDLMRSEGKFAGSFRDAGYFFESVTSVEDMFRVKEPSVTNEDID